MDYCGFDQGTKSIAVCVIDGKGRERLRGEAPLEKRKLRGLLKGFKKLRCVVEAGPLAESLCSVIDELGYEIEIIEARRAASVFKTKRKTDSLDAKKLALIARSGWYTSVHRKSRQSRALRTYLTARMQLVKVANSLKSSIRGLLRANGIVLKKGGFEEEVRVALAACDPLVQAAIEPMLEAWQLIQKQEQMLYRTLERKVVKSNPDARRFTTIPGIGPATAAAFVATIDDPKRFETGEQVASYLGLVPSVYQSGETEIRGRITKDGDELLRWLLNEAATTILTRCQTPTPLREWGLKLQEKKGFGKARTALARKLATLMHTLWLREETYDAAA